jgi:hypothetical protein
MDINSLTLGQAKELAAMFASSSEKTLGNGRCVVVRCRDAGVHFGYLTAFQGRTVWLTNARRLWKWKAKAGLALSGVAANGVVASESKLDSLVPAIVLLDACEIIDASETCRNTIEAA